MRLHDRWWPYACSKSSTCSSNSYAGACSRQQFKASVGFDFKTLIITTAINCTLQSRSSPFRFVCREWKIKEHNNYHRNNHIWMKVIDQWVQQRNTTEYHWISLNFNEYLWTLLNISEYLWISPNITELLVDLKHTVALKFQRSLCELLTDLVCNCHLQQDPASKDTRRI
jgi:hypothetical protein